MDLRTLTGTEFGAILRQRREALGIEIADLVVTIGGTPGAGFLSRLEEGIVGPSSDLVLRLADALALPPDPMLNAAGFASRAQRVEALTVLRVTVGPRRSNGA